MNISNGNLEKCSFCIIFSVKLLFSVSYSFLLLFIIIIIIREKVVWVKPSRVWKGNLPM